VSGVGRGEQAALNEQLRQSRGVKRMLARLAGESEHLEDASPQAQMEGLPSDFRRPRPEVKERMAMARRAVSRMHDFGVTSERAAVRLEQLIEADEHGVESRYLAAVASPACSHSSQALRKRWPRSSTRSTPRLRLRETPLPLERSLPDTHPR
jgi:hypothetical protein